MSAQLAPVHIAHIRRKICKRNDLKLCQVSRAQWRPVTPMKATGSPSSSRSRELLVLYTDSLKR